MARAKPSWDAIVADLHGEDLDRYVAACDALTTVTDRDWLPRLRDLLEHGESFAVREPAAEPVARMDGVASLPLLLRAMDRGTAEQHDNDGLSAEVSELVASHAGEVAPMLRAWIVDASATQRDHAAWLWGFAAAALPLEPLLGACEDPDPDVRRSAAGSLPEFPGDPRVLTMLARLVEDPEEGVRCSAADSLGYLGDPAAEPILRALLERWPAEERRFAEQSLRFLGRKPSS